MPFTRIFKAPDYYPSFACKCGDCIHTCCHGWAITVSMAEYFRLQGINCSHALRRTLDCAFVPVENPTAERFYAFNYDRRGDCRLHRESDGLCAVQRECGEDALPAICRMYPRAVRTRWADECGCSAGCEAVADLLSARREPLSFIDLPLTFPLEPETPERNGLITERYRPVREKCLEIIQNRALPLESRLDAIQAFAAELEEALRASDRGALDTALERNFCAELDGAAQNGFDLPSAKLLANYYGRHSRSLEPYAVAAAELFCTGDAVDVSLPDPALTAYRFYEAESHRTNFGIAAENLLANEIFISGFPFNANSPREAADALRALCTLLRYITAADASSTYAVFRVADNTDFYKIAPRLLTRSLAKV